MNADSVRPAGLVPARTAPVAWLLCCLLALLTPAWASTPAPPPPPELTSRPTRVIVTDDAFYAPFAFLDADNQPAGITIDIWKLWSRKTGIPVEFRLQQWDAALEAVKSGQADAVGGIFKTEERLKVFEYTRPFFTIPTSIFFSRQIHGIRGIDDLQGFPVGLIKGDSAEELILQQHLKVLLLTYPDAESMIKAALAGEVKVFVADSQVGRFYLAKHDTKGLFRETRTPIASSEQFSVVRKGNSRLLGVLDDGFARISDREIEEIVASWTGRAPMSTISWAKVGFYAALAALLLLGIVLWNLQLRRTVARATKEVEQRNRELAESEGRFRTFFDLSPFSCVVNDLEGRYRMVNRAFCASIGLTEEEVIGRTAAELGLRFDTESSTAALNDLQAHGEVNQREAIFTHGSQIGYALYSSRLMELGGEQLVLSSTVDISDRRRSEEALRESEERFAKAFTLSPAPMVISDIVTGRFIDVNEQWLRMLGHSREETIGRTSYELGIWEDPRVRTNLGKKIKKNGAFYDEPIRFITKAGATRDTLWSAVKVNLGGSEVMLSLIFDYTERKKVEQALRESESYNKVLFHDSHLALAVIDPESSCFMDCNRAAVSIYGFNHREELLGKHPWELSAPRQYDNQPSLSAAEEKIRSVLARGYEVFEWLHQRPDGEQWDSEVHLMTFTHGSRTLLQLSIEDITERKRNAREKESLQEQLAQAQKMESIGRLAGGVAHDFNNMLSVILGHTDLAKRQLDPSHPLTGRLDDIRTAAERSADLTRQLLAFARRQTVAPRVLDLNRTVEGMLTMVRRLIGENIDLTWLPGKQAGAISMDPSQLDQILVNLCVNARDAIGDTGRVTIETNSVSLDAAYCALHAGFLPGDYMVLSVSDTGCGMDAETRQHLFEPFYTTKTLGSGTGLGLATVYGIVSQNKGFIHVYSEPGQGSTFRIYLPGHRPESCPLPREQAEPPPARGHETILVVEDEPMILDITSTMLEFQGYTVLPAGSPSEALRLAEAHAGDIHLLITDVIMPEMNGRELAEKLRALYPTVRQLFMSGYTANVIAHHGVLDPKVHFIQKPFTELVLAVRVREALDAEDASTA